MKAYRYIMVGMLFSLLILQTNTDMYEDVKHTGKSPAANVVGTVKNSSPATNIKYANIIVDKYDVSKTFVLDVLKYVDKYAHNVFPRREDIIAVIGIESSWNPDAISPLKIDPAVGLTQIRPKTWKKLIPSEASLMDIEGQIKYAAQILRYNYKLTKDKDAAIIAYNVGYGNWLEGNHSFDYLLKFKSERSKFARG